ncbi:hypothetical protein DJ568_03690 [Mucilaginibacter hurinus]|uniref:Uncharacterized protein n=1 Tax=Mucilaginibacter hurinus TaxID=2201324 RepID=A0A367GSN3_9SPHI|nr:hypothetical protein [Mucilaginibacter hurinus]RCH55866.1 hypothetical protein DJ568_03690 [Mucilaginibacter hurinus]
MDTEKNQPDLNFRLKSWKESFSQTALTPADIEELAEHLENSYTDMLELGLTESEAWLIATHRIGEPRVIREEFEKVNNHVPVNRNWLLLLWGAVSLLILQAIFIILPIMFQNRVLDYFKPSNNAEFMAKEYYTIAIILVLLFLLLIIRSGKFINGFTNSLTRYASLYAIIAVVAGLWSAFFSYIIFANYSGFKYADHNSGVSGGISFLMFGFYFPLIAITAFSTLRYFSSDTIALKNFSKKINWKHAFLLGLLAQTPVQFTHALPYNDGIRASVIILLSVILFMVIGWMVGQSKKGVLNLFTAQLPSMGIWITGTIVNEEARLIFFIFYIVKIIALFATYLWSKRQQTQTYLAT